eukprot:3521509-Rhodomonas_salina.4
MPKQPATFSKTLMIGASSAEMIIGCGQANPGQPSNTVVFGLRGPGVGKVLTRCTVRLSRKVE